MYKFYSVVFTTKLGKESETFVIGKYSQVELWAAKEALSYGTNYLITYITTDRLSADSAIVNLCNL